MIIIMILIHLMLNNIMTSKQIKVYFEIELWHTSSSVALNKFNDNLRQIGDSDSSNNKEMIQVKIIFIFQIETPHVRTLPQFSKYRYSICQFCTFNTHVQMIEKSLNLNSVPKVIITMAKLNVDTNSAIPSMIVLKSIFRAPSVARPAPSRNEFELAMAMTDFPIHNPDQLQHKNKEDIDIIHQDGAQGGTTMVYQNSGRKRFNTIVPQETVYKMDETHL